MPGAVIYISEFQNKLAWKFDISVSPPLSLSPSLPLCTAPTDTLTVGMCLRYDDVVLADTVCREFSFEGHQGPSPFGANSACAKKKKEPTPHSRCGSGCGSQNYTAD